MLNDGLTEMLRTLVAVGVLAGWLFGPGLACPTACMCKWKGGKQTVECINKSLITIPQGMDQGTQVLEFAGNNLDRLLRERFQRMGLINLQKIFMPRCRIRHIEDKAFKGLTNLVELDLSDNMITVVPSETFYDFPSLMRLSLNGNQITILKTSAFQPLSYLTNLELSMCGIEVVEDGAFLGLNSLEWLKLDNNKINYIKGARILPENLHGIDLHHNPWQCDCKLLDFRSWLLNFNVPQTLDPVCASPSRLKGQQIKNLELDDLACTPDVTPTTLYLEIAEGKNVSLLCRVSAVPEAKVSWWFEGNVLQNDSMVAPGLHLYYFVEEGTFEKTSELFIFNTNADDNGTFVCLAENPAGKTHSNYTIRIILKEEPVISLAVFPYEYVAVVSAAVSVIAILTTIIIALCIVQCRRTSRRKRKKDRSKVAAMQSQQISNKAPVVRDSDGLTALTTAVIPVKANGTVCPKRDQEMVVYATGAVVQGGLNTLTYSHAPLAVYPDQNPDIINDTGSKEWRPKEELSADKEKDVPWNPGIVYPKHLTADVHLSPGKFIGPDGYPLDYGLPKLQPMEIHFTGVASSVTPAAFYRTLPHKTRHVGGNPPARFSREAEFLPKPCQPAPFEHYTPTPDVRYTVEGYPVYTPVFQDPFLSPPAPYKGEVPKTVGSQTGSSIPPIAEEEGSRQSVGAQTNEPDTKPSACAEPQDRPALTESPDEGYVGDSAETSDI